MIKCEKDLLKVPRAQVLPLTEVERIYEEICEKNGDPDHDRACDIFDMQEEHIKFDFHYDQKVISNVRRIFLPKGTVVT